MIQRKRHPGIPALKCLFARTQNQCSFPGCHNKMTTEDGIIIGEVAHIEGYAQTSPRHNPNLSESECNQVENLILLCHEHHVMIDNDPQTYTVTVLRDMKKKHEAKGRVEILPIDTKFAEQYSRTYYDKENNSIRNINIGSGIQMVTSGPMASATCKIYKGKRKPPTIIPPSGLIGQNPTKRAYIKYLHDRCIDFGTSWEKAFNMKRRKKPDEKTEKAIAARKLCAAVRKKFGNNENMLPEDFFENVCCFLQTRILSTIPGRHNTKLGNPSFTPFENWVAQRSNSQTP